MKKIGRKTGWQCAVWMKKTGAVRILGRVLATGESIPLDSSQGERGRMRLLGMWVRRKDSYTANRENEADAQVCVLYKVLTEMLKMLVGKLRRKYASEPRISGVPFSD